MSNFFLNEFPAHGKFFIAKGIDEPLCFVNFQPLNMIMFLDDSQKITTFTELSLTAWPYGRYTLNM